MKVVINRCFGGFGLSDRALAEYKKRTGLDLEYSYDIDRRDGVLVAIVEEMGDDANDFCSNLKVIDIPFDSEPGDGWYIHDYDGLEEVRQTGGVWC